MPNDREFEEFVLFYNNEFLPAYSDMVGFIVYKPEEVLISLEHSFSHILQYFTPGIAEELKRENLLKAKHHIQRATLDCYKIFWHAMDVYLVKLVDDHNKRKFCINMTEGDFLRAFFDFKTKAQEARRIEARNVGINLLETIEAYKTACSYGKIIYNNIDTVKMADFDKLRTKIWAFISAREYIAGVLTAVIAGLIILAIDCFFFRK